MDRRNGAAANRGLSMAIQVSTLRPGLLVSLKSTISGNVKYRTNTIEADHLTEEGAKRARWETERTVTDPKEHERATEARGKARHAVARVCAWSAFGLLCPEDKTAELEAGIAEARRIADEFNATASFSRISVYVISGRIAADDVEAVRAINSEVSDLLDAMQQGVKNLDAEAIRKAANAARGLGTMLSPAAAARVADAVEAARTAARKIIKAGESAATEVDRIAIRKITEARTAFIDLDDAAEVSAPVSQGRAVDFEPEAEERAADTLSRPALVDAARASLDMDEEPAPFMQAAPAAPQFALEF